MSEPARVSVEFRLKDGHTEFFPTEEGHYTYAEDAVRAKLTIDRGDGGSEEFLVYKDQLAFMRVRKWTEPQPSTIEDAGLRLVGAAPTV